MFNGINKRLSLGVALIFIILLIAVSAALAGGWTVVTLDQLPSDVVVGQPLKVGFMIRQHGNRPWVYDQVTVHLTHLESHEEISVRAEAKGVPGHYEAVLNLPQAGTWQWGVAAGLMPRQQPMPDLLVRDSASVTIVNATAPLAAEKAAVQVEEGRPASVPLGVGVMGVAGTVGALLFWLRTRTPMGLVLLTVTAVIGAIGFGLAATPAALPMTAAEQPEPLETLPEPVIPAASADLGQALFVAKGCIVCHRHEAVNSVRQRFIDFEDFRVGPDLPTLASDPELLQTWLKDPSAVKPETQMPNLALQQPEIEALVTFLLHSKPNR